MICDFGKYYNDNQNDICDILKQTIYNEGNVKLLSDLNVRNYISFSNVIKNNDKMKTLLLSTLKQYGKFMNKIKEYKRLTLNKDTKILELTAEIKTYKKKIKNLNDLVGKMTFNSSSISELNAQIPDAQIPPEVFQTSNLKSLNKDFTDGNWRDTLQLYESIKHFMIKKKVSLSQLCKSNKRKTSKYLALFLNLQWARVKIAHPPHIDIKTDEQFFQLLDSN